METATAEIVETSSNGHAVRVSMTSVYDVARFVAAAIELGTATWPREFKMRGDQMTALDIVTTCSNVARRWVYGRAAGIRILVRSPP